MQEFKEKIFQSSFNEPLIHQVINGCVANAHQGLKKQKSRSEVTASGKKPWRQKGTGRARAGTVSSPIWRKGGVTFAARPIQTKVKINKKMFKSAISSILSELVRLNRVSKIEELTVSSNKTKDFISTYKEHCNNRTLFIVEEPEQNLILATRNIPNIHVVSATKLNPITLLKFENIVITNAAVKKLEEIYL